MGRYVQLGDVRTYYEDDGHGDPLVLLPPGLADSRAFEANPPGLRKQFRVWRHRSFPVSAEKMRLMHLDEPAFTPTDLGGYPHPALIMIGDRDDEIPIEHILALRAGLPDAQLAVIPGTGHGSLADKPDLCEQILIDFLTEPAAPPPPVQPPDTRGTP